MEIKYKTIEHERVEDAPFVGALICADNCKFRCKGCFNEALKKEKAIVATEQDIINEVLSNPFNKGIIFGGLEWSEQAVEMLHIGRLACDNNLEVMIYTGCDSLQDFHEKIGKVVLSAPEFKSARPPKLSLDKNEYYAFIGRLTLDNFIYNDYYIKVGKYDATKKVDDRFAFGVKLSTENQKLYKIESEKNDETESKTN